MKKQVSVRWDHNMVFQGVADDRFVQLDTAEIEGGNNEGIRPKALILIALGAATGMDVIGQLNEKKQIIKGFEVNVEATIDRNEPLVFNNFEVTYIISGEELKTPDIVTAVCKSMTEYCGVALMLKKIAPISYNIFANGVKLDLSKFETDSGCKI